MQLGRLRALAAAAAGTLAWAGTAHAAVTDFATSFEATDPPPTWISTAERASGVTGPLPTGIPGNVTDTVVAVRASGENTGGGEVKENLVDGSPESKWLVFARTGWVELELAQPVAVVHYALTSANDAAGRDPRAWTLQGSQDGSTWTDLDTQVDQSFGQRFETKEYRFANPTAYRHYRLDITRNNGDDLLQLAELQLSNGSTAPPPLGDMRTAPGAGPRGGYNAKSGAGFTGLKALEYGGRHTSAGHAYSYNKVYDVDIRVRRRTELSYLIYPNFIRDDLRYPSTYVAVDLAFTDGTRLSDLRVRDQHGARLSPQGQGASKTLYTNQWNFKRARIGAVAAGKRIDRILVGYDNPEGPASFGGWIDDITITGRPPRQRRSRPSDWVLTTRGTNSSGSFSRGNNIPATAVPHGFNFWTPVTNANSLSWIYEYHKANNAENLPTLQAFSASHEPSPWMGDRQTFQVMPSAAGEPPTGRSERALAFRHADEVARPHYYGVTFENGVKTEIAPADHAAMFRFTFPGTTSSLIFDNVDEDAAGLSIDQAAGVVTGWSDVASGLSNGATRMYVYATFDKPITASEQTRDRTGYARFDARTVTMRIATSLISVEQARHNLELEIGPRDRFEHVRDRAQAQWDRKLGVIEVEGATEDQRTTLYSNLYRLFLYPNSAHENTGTAARPVWRHAVQSSTTTPPSTPDRTGAPVVDGKVYVNNGFWDTYRTTWSAYSLFTPRMAGELVDGFVQQYRDGGWISRWSSPGYANLMTGTSSDVAFADAFVKGVRGFDARDAYAAAVKNATVAPPGDPFNPSVGRKGLVQSIFLGYTPSRVSEGVSWALEGYINDFGIANMAARLATQARTAAERRRYAEEAEYFRSRALNYVNMFDPAIRFFQGRAADGTWKSPPGEYDPRVWGHEHDYTETNGWNFAFHVPHDGQGLANLYGGRDRLAEKLDRFFSIPETAGFPGSYGGIIHEMVEARDVRMGQWGFSNQVSHHIPWMYGYVGQPYKTQEKVREVLRRLYVGSEIGQGYAGDEDNGETSAWYLFSALGLYPLQVGSEDYAIGSPLFKKATVRLERGRKLVIRAPRTSRRNVYVQGLRVDGRRHDRAYIGHRELADGATLTFDMGPEPSDWATRPDAALRSLTQSTERPAPLRDVTAREGALFDDDSRTTAAIGAPLEVTLPAGAKRIRYYTLTSGPDGAADPHSWVLKGSVDGANWTVLDERRAETFAWRSQTRAFKVAAPGSYAHYRIEPGAVATVGEIELLADVPADASPLRAAIDGAIASAGETVALRATVTNHGETDAAGEVRATGPDGWTLSPAAASFGPIGPEQSATVTFLVTVPAGTAPGGHRVRVAVASAAGTVQAVGTVTVIADRVAFTPDTADEAPWLFEPGGSQLNGDVFDGRARFADGANHFTYRFPLPPDVTGGTLTLDIGNQFLVRASTDNATWTTVLEETRPIRDSALNRAERTLDLNALRGAAGTLYLRIQDSQPDDGWGAWLARLQLDLERP